MVVLEISGNRYKDAAVLLGGNGQVYLLDQGLGIGPSLFDVVALSDSERNSLAVSSGSSVGPVLEVHQIIGGGPSEYAVELKPARRLTFYRPGLRLQGKPIELRRSNDVIAQFVDGVGWTTSLTDLYTDLVIALPSFFSSLNPASMALELGPRARLSALAELGRVMA